MTSETVMTIVFSVLSVGGIGSIVVKAIIDRRKNNIDATASQIKASIELQDTAVARYKEAVADLDRAQQCLDEARDKLEMYRVYTGKLAKKLRENGIDVPPMPDNL